ncbi:MAG TPA: prolipoprotein diacylglyceryl transferase [Rhodospirillaceae bacterium]|nr:prolipoprotein diacylglyceryl transferase [Rhodospirillaceae bacterium]HAA91365.1 prolipoprotein diacylglyceryl transferase [Rhodospirillaceae bacterium]HAT35942.1 prolipoprotein diacylglyceryl transferase [Rhodospirillaceae bacterium]
MGPFVHPEFDPIAFSIGPLAIRWYALAYIVGLVFGWRYCLRLTRRPPQIVKELYIDDLFVWVTLGVLIGGRLGFVVFYNPGYYLSNPLEIVQPWKGGMAFHGGLVGVMVAVYIYGRLKKTGFWPMADMLAAAVPVGLFLGRVGNFVNGELWGRVTDVPWGVIFPRAGPDPRHPSQLYEAGLEGLVLFGLLAWLIFRRDALTRPGLVGGTFLIGYGCARAVVETVRAETHFAEQLPLGLTFGQLLSVPMILLGIYIVRRAMNRPVAETPVTSQTGERDD